MKFRGKRLYCKALTGENGYIMSIASDLTLSCNCNDKYGFGKIGDLRLHSLPEILSGQRATFFRKCLAEGRIPILNCVTCISAGQVDKRDAPKYIRDYHLPSKIMVESNVNCNLRCIACDRERIYQNRTQREMSLNDIRHVSKCLKQNNIREIYYFNYGEPFLSKTIKEELEIIRRDNPDISIITSTNGILLDSEEKMEAALGFDHIYFSIHGSTQESLTRYQRGGDFAKAYSNMKALIEIRDSKGKETPVVEWKYVLFRWNDSPTILSKATKLAREAKVDILSFWPTLSPFYGISFKYFLKWSYFKDFGQPSWKGREIDFRQEKIPR